MPPNNLLRLLDVLGEKVVDGFFYIDRKVKENKLKNLRKTWDSVQRGTPLICKDLIVLYSTSMSEEEEGTHPVIGAKIHILYVDRAVMLMGVYYPEINDDPLKEKPVRFLFWCNNGYYAYRFYLSSFNGKLPFEVMK